MAKKRRNQESIDNKRQKKKEGDVDWITALAKQVTSDTNNSTIKSKAERIEKRNAKRKRREQSKGYILNESRKSKQQHQRQQELVSKNDNKNGHPKQTEEECMLKLHQLSNEIDMAIQLSSDSNHNSNTGKKRIIPFSTVNIETKKGKAVAGMTIQNSSQIQPRSRDYNGLGLARPSIFLSLRDDSFIPKLEEEFAEHIDGFFGKQRTKAMKKQLDGNMLWRQLLRKKQQQNLVKN